MSFGDIPWTLWVIFVTGSVVWTVVSILMLLGRHLAWIP